MALGGGGIAGYSFHTGALGAIKEMTGWDPRTADIILGTSAGSSIAAVLRGNVSVGELVDRVLSVPTDPAGMDRLRRVAGRGQSLVGGLWFGPSSPRLVAKEVLRLRRARAMRMVAGALPSGRIDNGVLGEQADVLHPNQWPELDMWLPAVDLESGELTVFGRDGIRVDVATAVAASCAIPGFFQPVQIGERRYVDGGVRSMVNADLLADPALELDLVVILAPMSVASMDVRTPLSSLARSLPRRQLRSELDVLAESGVNTLVLEPDQAVSRSMGLNPMDPTRVVPVLVDSAASMTDVLRRPEHSTAVDTLCRAARVMTSPADVPYPD